jgi:hypothetical protein
MTERRRFVALRGKITPSSRVRTGSADFGGTVDRAQGSAEEARDLDERDPATNPAGEHELASEVSERIRAIISSAEAAANAVRHEADQRAQIKRRVADDEAKRIVADAQQDAEAFLQERIRRISELSDAVVERGEGIVMRLDRAEEVRAQLQELADALGQSAEELARELGEKAERRAAPEAIATEAPAEPEAEAVEAEAVEAEAAVESEDAVDVADAEEVEAEIVDDPTVGELAGEATEAEEAEAGADEDAEPEAEEEATVTAVEIVPDEPAEAAEPGPREPDEQLSARLVALQMAVAGGKRAEVEAHLQRTFTLDDVSQILDDVFGAGDGGEKQSGWPSTGDGAA